MLAAVLLVFASFFYRANGDVVCYEPFGCFSDDAPFDHYLMTNPKDPSYVRTSFTIHTQYRKRKFSDFSNRTLSEAARVLDGENLKIIVHGILESSDKSWVRKLKKGLLQKKSTDVIIVDYEEGATSLLVTGNARLVGAQLAYLLKAMFRLKNRNGKQVHIIGFSAGAHVAGYAGTRLKQDGYSIGRITGLDPGDLPYGLRIYEHAHPLVRLDKSDADFVDAIHTDTNGLGMDKPVGHLDFYPNGGVKQPGCGIISTIKALKGVTSREKLFYTIGCNHIRAVNYFTESLSKSSCKFTAYPCEDIQELERGQCDTQCEGGVCPVMGYDAVKTPNATLFTGKHLYLQTNGKAPFCKTTIEPKEQSYDDIFTSLFNKLGSYFF